MTTIVIVDDHAGFRAEARAVLAADGFDVVGEASDATGAIGIARAVHPVVMLVDIGLPDADGFSVATALAQDPSPPVVVLTSSRDAAAFGARVAASSAAGFVAKDDVSGDAIRAFVSRAATSSPRSLRVVIAEDSPLLRQGLARLLTDEGFDVAGQAGAAEDLVALVRHEVPDVAIVDIRMPPTQTDEGLRAAAAIRAEHGSRVGILLLSQYVEASFAMRALESADGGVGYLLKDRVADVDVLADAVRRVAAGGSVMDPDVVAALVRRRRDRDRLVSLSERERETLMLMAEGRSNQAIAERLFVTPKTVEAHIASIFSKLGLLPAADDHRRVLAVLTFLRMESPER